MLEIETLGIKPYELIWNKMKSYTIHRDENASDKLWLLQHPPVYTQGQAGKPEHLLNKALDIPLVQSDRGGQITYHGPGQLVGYLLMDLRRKNLGIRTLVHDLEQLLIDVLADYGINGETQCKAPGVYVHGKKIASIGLRVKNGCTYHGIALNVDMDLKPFLNINPCGYKQLQMTQMADFSGSVCIEEVSTRLAAFATERWGE